MAQKGKTRKARKGGGWFTRNSKSFNNVKNNAASALKNIKKLNEKASVQGKAKTAATRRWDYQGLEKKKDKLLIQRRRTEEDLEDIDKKQKHMINEELIKQAQQWAKAAWLKTPALKSIYLHKERKWQNKSYEIK